MDARQTIEEATAAASLTVDLIDLGQASVAMTVGREHTNSLFALL
ncbi:hypothetical protein FHS29_005580 [Saccharothrix tamanrassetensis]|uniref:Uncharacterized protein n=1 Tax=Saccharothrix tamanrassetensis TaxID=1051531 RepID=A0A841CMW4_9PSEU|nr:hypothetical protein [Saccharothrix tamanrassetensis]MBB5958971.1 hypothetical protein [Saccharothrix tamanrassetensis]